ncbi:proline dehydrogenase family protein [Rapidithrix thailandica]|uniref:Proline dehydrogenase family protein n=1 Tax=Rapidithrix thailandica TaxID=413964 RepID=A0AAW9SB35_9BACT
MRLQSKLSFDNTSDAFAYKSDAELKKAQFIFSSMRYPWLVNLGIRLTPTLIHWNFPITGLIRSTIFEQFVGGESLERTATVVQKLADHHVEVILDYGVEGKATEASFEQACKEFIHLIEYTATQPNIPFISIKLTGLARFQLLEKLSEEIQLDKNMAMVNLSGITLNAEEQTEWLKVIERVDRICAAAAIHKVGVLIDAEESWIQQAIDAVALYMMEKYNHEQLLIYNTYQLYRHDRLQFLIDNHTYAQRHGFLLGAKLVRGAYMEKENLRAQQMGYLSPIQPDKEATDRDYNAAVEYCLAEVNSIGTVVASHNEWSNEFTTNVMSDSQIPLDHPHVHFSQLYGMSDHITFNLAKAGCKVSKYLPYGPIKDVIPYLLRRAQENSSISGQTGRELELIQKELIRRRITTNQHR